MATAEMAEASSVEQRCLQGELAIVRASQAQARGRIILARYESGKAPRLYFEGVGVVGGGQAGWLGSPGGVARLAGNGLAVMGKRGLWCRVVVRLSGNGKAV
jgi:hypothetical protein